MRKGILSYKNEAVDPFMFRKLNNRESVVIKILVVEDNLISQQAAKSLLTIRGYDVEIAGTGKEALAMVNNQHYAAILMDMGLPDMDGTMVTRMIREAEKGTNQHISIIALTANGYEAKQKCLDAGMDDFSLKPFNAEVLHQQIKAAIAKYPQAVVC